MRTRGRGRPPTFTPEQRQQLAELVKQFGIRETVRKSEWRVCSWTLTQIAREFGIKLTVGRRRLSESKALPEVVESRIVIFGSNVDLEQSKAA
jgi:transposase-like protein